MRKVHFSIFTFLKNNKTLCLLSVIWSTFFIFYFLRLFQFRSEGIFVGSNHVYGDWAAHFSWISRLSYTEWWPSSHPLIIDHPPTYTFVVNLFSAYLHRAGIGFITSALLVSVILVLIIGPLSYQFFKHVFFQKNSHLTLPTFLLFWLNGGIGFIYFFKSLRHDPLGTLAFPPHRYTQMPEYFIQVANLIDTQLIPQRSFALGFPIGLALILFCYRWIWLEKKPSVNLISFVIIILGILPLIHVHTLMAVLIISSSWWGFKILLAMIEKKSLSFTQIFPQELDFLLTLSLGVLLAILVIRNVFGNEVGSNFLQWYPGWYTQVYETNILNFWWLNWGIIPFIAFAEWLLQDKKSKAVYLPFLIIFLSINLFLFQPFIFDNTKLFTYASLGMVPLAILFLHRLWQMKYLRILVVGAFIFSIASGSIDVYRMQRVEAQMLEMYSAEELAAAEWMKDNTDPQSVVLTVDKHNSWVSNLTGRQVIMGYRGFNEVYGISQEPMATDIDDFYRGNRQEEILQRYEVDYVVVGRAERERYGSNIQITVPDDKVVMQSNDIRIYQVK